MTSPGADKVILLVEDNEDDVFIMQRALQAAHIGNRLVLVTDGQQAVDYLGGKGAFANREQHPFPSLMFLDLKMPYLNGLDVLLWIRQQKNLPALTIIILTSSNEPSDLTAAYRAGANSYMVKPATSAQLNDLKTTFRLDWLA